MPTQPLLHSTFSTGQGNKITWKSLWVEIKTGRPLTRYYHDQNRLDLEKVSLIYFQLKIEWDGEKQRQN